jgi:pimeloyl-ACP methyl ester carboxylesterase
MLDSPGGDHPPVAPLGRQTLHRHPVLERVDRGGHFGAFEQPELFVADVRAFFSLVR